jgi:hypothetical protein
MLMTLLKSSGQPRYVPRLPPNINTYERAIHAAGSEGIG